MLAGKGPDIILALHAVALCARMPSSEHPSLYRAGLLSSFGAVRTIALRALLDLGPDDHAAIARAALADPQSSVRSLAIAHLAATGEHPAVLYRQLLANRGDTADQGARRIRIALTGLASMRERSDLALFRQFSSHPVGAVRLAALAGWLRVAEEDKDAVAAQALADPVAGVRKLALYAVRRRGAYLNFDLVRNSLEACGDLVLLLNFARASRWNWIECIVRAALRRPWDAPLTTMLAAALRHWLDSRSDQYSVPSPGQRVFLDEPYVLATLARLLNERTDLQLRLAQALQR